MIEELFAAIRADDADAVGRLVDADPSLLSQRNAGGISPLSWAAYLGKASMVEALHARRGVPDLYEACIVGDADLAVSLIARRPASIDEPAPDGFTALGLAVFFGHPQLAERLVAVGADVDARATNTQRVGAIHAAAAKKDLASLTLLLTHGADPNLPQEQGFRALHEAASSGHYVAAGLLLLFGADPEIANDAGQRPADLARANGYALLAMRIDAASRRVDSGIVQ